MVERVERAVRDESRGRKTTETSGSGRQGLLVLALIAAFGLYAWQKETGQSLPDLPIPMAKKGELIGPASHTGVDQLNLVDVNFWEARVEVTYSLEQKHGNGYVALHMTDGGWHSNVGLKTAPGQSKGVALLSRHSDRPDGYHISKVRAQMYDPYRRDRNYYEQYHQVSIDWPDADSLGVVATPNSQVFKGVKAVRVFRNVPNYIEFNKQLVKEGVPPEIIDLSLAVCRACPGSIIFGEGVPVAAVQSVIRALDAHDFALDRIEYSQLDRHDGYILVGQSPTDRSKSFWAVQEAVMAEDVSSDTFFELIGFEQPPAHEQAVALHKRAKALIDFSGRDKDLARAGVLLDRALVLDNAYMPIYIEMARLQTRKERGFSAYRPSESTRLSMTILKNALKVDPEFADIYVLLGYYQTAMHEFDAAMASFDRAEELGTDNLWLYANKSIWYELNNQPKRAIKALERVTEHELDESNNDRALKWVLQRLPPHYIAQQRYGDAQVVFERIVEEFPATESSLREYTYFLATYTDQYTRMTEIVAEAGRTDCDCDRELEAVSIFVDAARAAPRDKEKSIRLLVQAQSAGLPPHYITTYLSMGGSGRLLVSQLVPEIVTVSEIEESGSLLAPVLTQSGAEARTFLLDLGADTNLIDPTTNVSPLMLAVAMDDVELVRELLRHGGDPTAANSDGVTALRLAQDTGNDEILALFSAGQA